MNYSSALNHYKTIGVQSSVTDASPHRMIALLLDGAMDRIATAKGAISRDNVVLKGELISKAIGIVDGLRASLDQEKGGDIAANLAALYDYIERCLLEGNLHSSVEKLDEASALLREIREGWCAIPMEQREARADVGA